MRTCSLLMHRALCRDERRVREEDGDETDDSDDDSEDEKQGH